MHTQTARQSPGTFFFACLLLCWWGWLVGLVLARIVIGCLLCLPSDPRVFVWCSARLLPAFSAHQPTHPPHFPPHLHRHENTISIEASSPARLEGSHLHSSSISQPTQASSCRPPHRPLRHPPSPCASSPPRTGPRSPCTMYEWPRRTSRRWVVGRTGTWCCGLLMTNLAWTSRRVWSPVVDCKQGMF